MGRKDIREPYNFFRAFLNLLIGKYLGEYRGITQQVLLDFVRATRIALKAIVSMDGEMRVASSKKIAGVYEKYRVNYIHAQYGGIKQMVFGIDFVPFSIFFCDVFVKPGNDRA